VASGQGAARCGQGKRVIATHRGWPTEGHRAWQGHLAEVDLDRSSVPDLHGLSSEPIRAAYVWGRVAAQVHGIEAEPSHIGVILDVQARPDARTTDGHILQ